MSGLPGVKWMSWTACDSGVNGPWTLGGGEMTCDSFPNCASRNIAEEYRRDDVQKIAATRRVRSE